MGLKRSFARPGLSRARFQKDPCGVEAIQVVADDAQRHSFQKDPCGVEAAYSVSLFGFGRAGFRRTLVGLKPRVVCLDGRVFPSFRRTLVGLKPDEGDIADAAFAGFRRTLVRLKRRSPSGCRS